MRTHQAAPVRNRIQAIDAPLTNEQIYSVAPSIFQADAHHSRSEQYAYLSTREVLTALRDEGFFPFFAMQSGARTDDKREFTKHMLRFRQAAHMNNLLVGDDVNEIVLVNSHDGSTSYQLNAGVFRLVCTNGMIAGTSFTDVRILHKAVTSDDVIEGTYTVVRDFDLIEAHKEGMKSIQLSAADRMSFAAQALALRYDTEEAHPSLRQLLQPRRTADAGNDLWTTFNVLQENLIRGGQVKSVNPDPTGRRMSSRAVNSISESVRLNRLLWDLAEQTKLELIGATA